MVSPSIQSVLDTLPNDEQTLLGLSRHLINLNQMTVSVPGHKHKLIQLVKHSKVGGGLIARNGDIILGFYVKTAHSLDATTLTVVVGCKFKPYTFPRVNSDTFLRTQFGRCEGFPIVGLQYHDVQTTSNMEMDLYILFYNKLDKQERSEPKAPSL